MCKSLGSFNSATFTCSSFFRTKRNLPLLLLFQLATFGSLAQTKGGAVLSDSLIEYGQVIIPYINEKEALTFDPASSTWVEELTWSKAVQKVKPANGHAAASTVFSATVAVSPRWAGKEIFLVILTPKKPFEIELNGHRKKLASPGVNTQIRLTPFLKAKGGAITIKVTSVQDAGNIDALAHKFFLMATPNMHFATSRVRVNIKYPENYRALHWSYHFRTKNYSKSPRYSSFFRTEEKVRDSSGKEVIQITSDSTEQGNQKPIKGHSYFFYNNPEVYSYKWTAETPNLFLVTSGNFSSRYDASEVISERVGLRMSEIKKGELRINNVPAWFKPAVYVHPPFDAPVPTKEKLRDYIIHLKQYHFNTLLVHDLPVNNDLYDLADEYGLYLIQYLDADQEGKTEDEARDEVWLRQRLSLLYQVRNRPSLIAWATNSNMLNDPTPLVTALRDSLKAIDLQRPVLNNGKAITNLPTSAPQIEQLTAEGLLELQKKQQPVSMKISDDNSISVTNLYDFATLDDVLLQWKILDGEKVIQQGEVNELSIKPGNFQLVKLPFNFNSFTDSAYSLKLEVILQEELPWASKGFILAWEELKLGDQNLQLDH